MNLDETKTRLSKSRALLSCYKGIRTNQWIRRSLARTGKNHWRKQTVRFNRQVSEIKQQIQNIEQRQLMADAETEILKGNWTAATTELLLCESKAQLLETDIKIRAEQILELKQANGLFYDQQNELERFIAEASVSDTIESHSTGLFKLPINNQASVQFKQIADKNANQLSHIQKQVADKLKKPALFMDTMYDTCRMSFINFSEQIFTKSNIFNHSEAEAKLLNGTLNSHKSKAEAVQPNNTELKNRLNKYKRKYFKRLSKLKRKIAIKPTGKSLPPDHLLHLKISILEDLISKQRKDLLRVSLENAELKRKLQDASRKSVN